jgi:SAM-dependent methyltransferase
VPDEHLVGLVSHLDPPRGRALEIGCGTGTNAIWLAQQGFEEAATDLSKIAIVRARDKAAAAGVALELVVADALVDPLPPGPFDLVFDRGCFHVFDAAAERRRFAEQVASVLEPGGRWLSLVGSTDGPPRDTGPPRRSARDLVGAVEDHFEILSLEAVHFAAHLDAQPRAWRALYAKRAYPPQPSSVRNR